MSESVAIASKLEALLFVYGDALSFKKAMSVLAVSKEQLLEARELLKNSLQERSSGLALFEHDDTLQLVTRAEYSGLLAEVVKAEMNESLTPAGLETLAIIAYAGPISRAEIDYIRGVNSSYTVRALSLRGLIEREVDSKRANVFLYRPSADLLRHLGVESTSDLPDYARLRQVASSISQASSDSIKTEATNVEAAKDSQAAV
jgi:segregation and condensation protein B